MPHPKLRTTLDMHPDLAYKVGLVVAEYALLERLLYSIYAMLARAEPLVRLTKFYSIHSLGQRKRIVRIAACSVLSPAYLRALNRLLRRFSTAANRRTEVAHCEYLADETHVMRLELSDEAVRFVPLTHDDFENTFTQYHILGTDLLTFLAQAAIAHGLEEKVRQVLRVVPRAPKLAIPPSAQGPQHPPTQSEIDENIASLSRLGFQVAPPPDKNDQ